MAETDEKPNEKPEKLEYLSLSCPRPSEFITRAKITGKDEVICQRGNVEILDEFFHQLEFREIDQLRLHLLKIRPEDCKVFEEKLKKSGDYKVKGIIFNQSVNPQLIIDFSLKSSEILEYLLVKGYNQKYPCNKTDYLIIVSTHNCDFPKSLIIKTQVPLLCQPFAWTYQEKEYFLLEQIPEWLSYSELWLSYSEFVVGTEFFFNEPVAFTKKTFPSDSTECRRIEVRGDEQGVTYEMKCCEKHYSKLRKRLVQFQRPCLLQSEEEWDALNPNQKSLITMPEDIFLEILEHLSFQKKLVLRNTCKEFRTFIDSRMKNKRTLFSIVILRKNGGALVEGQYFSIDDLDFEFANIFFRIGKVECLDLSMQHKKFEKVMKETEYFGSMGIEHLTFNVFGTPKMESILKFLTEKCENPLKSIDITYSGSSMKFAYAAELKVLLSIKNVKMSRISDEKRAKILKGFLEKWTKGDVKIGSTLKMELLNSKKNTVSTEILDTIRGKYADKIISDITSDTECTLRLRTDNPTKLIKIRHQPLRTVCKVCKVQRKTPIFVRPDDEFPE